MKWRTWRRGALRDGAGRGRGSVGYFFVSWAVLKSWAWSQFKVGPLLLLLLLLLSFVAATLIKFVCSLSLGCCGCWHVGMAGWQLHCPGVEWSEVAWGGVETFNLYLDVNFRGRKVLSSLKEARAGLSSCQAANAANSWALLSNSADSITFQQQQQLLSSFDYS